MGDKASSYAAALIVGFLSLAGFGIITSDSNQTLVDGRYNMPVNLVPLPEGWWIDRDAQTYDLTVQHGTTGSLRLDKPTEGGNNPARECNSVSISVKPGDTLTFSCWMKTTASSLGDTEAQSGARIGLDFYDSHLITGVAAATYPNTEAGVEANYVPWDTDEWTQRTISFTIPATVDSDGSYYTVGESHVPSTVILWMQVWSVVFYALDEGQAWFSDPECYIVPLDETPLVEPSYSDFSVSDSSVAVGEGVSVNVTVTGTDATPTGTVTFYRSDLEDPSLWLQIGQAKTLDGSGDAVSDLFYPNQAGNYLIKAEYSGDTVYTDYSSTDSLLTVSNPVTVTEDLTNNRFYNSLLKLEDKSVTYTFMDYEFVAPGFTDITPLDLKLAKLEDSSVTTYWINPQWIKSGLADHTPFDKKLLALES